MSYDNTTIMIRLETQARRHALKLAAARENVSVPQLIRRWRDAGAPVPAKPETTEKN